VPPSDADGAFHPRLDLVRKQIIESDKELIEGGRGGSPAPSSPKVLSLPPRARWQIRASGVFRVRHIPSRSVWIESDIFHVAFLTAARSAQSSDSH
jgi:hypothetical protein